MDELKENNFDIVISFPDVSSCKNGVMVLICYHKSDVTVHKIKTF